MLNCGKIVNNNVKKCGQKSLILNVDKNKTVNKFYSHVNFKRVLNSFSQLFLTYINSIFHLLNGSFTRFPHRSTTITIYIKNF